MGRRISFPCFWLRRSGPRQVLVGSGLFGGLRFHVPLVWQLLRCFGVLWCLDVWGLEVGVQGLGLRELIVHERGFVLQELLLASLGLLGRFVKAYVGCDFVGCTQLSKTLQHTTWPCRNALKTYVSFRVDQLGRIWFNSEVRRWGFESQRQRSAKGLSKQAHPQTILWGFKQQTKPLKPRPYPQPKRPTLFKELYLETILETIIRNPKKVGLSGYLEVHGTS